MTQHKIPVILDTDIGGDIDDTWALAMLLKSPELDLKLVVSDTGDTEYRARILARLLEVAGRTDVPVGVGLREKENGEESRQWEWVKEYPLDSYPGTVHQDGVQAIIDTIMQSDKPVRLICIGPVPNIQAALKREPRIAEKAHFVGMHGSFAKHHTTNEKLAFEDGAIPEWNIRGNLAAAQDVFATRWKSATITPLDTCGCIVLDGERYQRLRNIDDPVMRAVMENYRIWASTVDVCDPETHSSVLFDTVAVYLAFSTAHIDMQRFGIRVDDKGFTVRDETAPLVNVALNWIDIEAYYDFLTERLLAPVTQG